MRSLIPLDARQQNRQCANTCRENHKKTRKTRIKKLTGLKQPQFRLPVGDVRVFYDVNDEKMMVEVLGIVSKSRAQRWLKQKGVGR